MTDLMQIRERYAMPFVTVFGNSAPKPGSAAYEQARQVGRVLGSLGYGVVNGGYGGTMTASAQGVREEGGVAVGVTIADKPWTPNPHLTENIAVPEHLDRLLMLVELGSGYVVLPGGTGTLLELAYVWEGFTKGLLPARPLVVVGNQWAEVTEIIICVQPRSGRYIQRISTPEELRGVFPPVQPR